ncbi:DNA-packaging protein [Puniceibacterium sp. IMCC21224]|uniref:DNA-packaging protein n=1 Tax=Puniceibacterium sp. IMCC21224 TaxID=1618204 RepID=UPI0009E549D9|nr:terminase family protein [Puniceibacterium sp. IMCC21224]
MGSTLNEQDLRSGAVWLASADAAVREGFLRDLSQGEILALPYLFEFWAMPHQLPPEGDWRAWAILGGRGAGKTRAGSEWVRAMVEGARPLDQGRCKRVALVGETLDQVREVMVFGESGILACSPPDRRPNWNATRKALVWPNGAEAMAFSAHDPESLRGPQFDAAWVDELAKWKKGQDTWDMLQFGLRLGERPQVCVTTTPRNVGVLKALLKVPTTRVTHALTEANRANLAESFLEEVRARYQDTRLGRQELDGVLLEDTEGALWTREMLDALRVQDLPEFDRIIVAVDPPVTGKVGSDACGIVVVGAVLKGPPQEWHAVVLDDATVQGRSPTGWANAALRAMEHWGADRLVAEVNQGGDMVETVLRSVDALVPVTKVHASRGKVSRAEPVAALYEQGRVRHVGGLADLEDQMSRMTQMGYDGKGSPDRVDALVWALTDLMITPAAKWRRPSLRTL